jgi:hypothetical protein
MERTLFEIAGAVKTLLLTDNDSKNMLLENYAGVLMDLDLSKDIFYEVMVECKGFTFPVEIEYEGLQEFCTHCKSIGHNVTFCLWLHPKQAVDHEHPNDKGKNPVISQKGYSKGWKPHDNPEGIESSKAFEVAAPQ